MKKTEKNRLIFDHVEELLVRISLDLKKELDGLSGEKAEEIQKIILAINLGTLFVFTENEFGQQTFLYIMPDDSQAIIKRSLSKMPFVSSDEIQDDARDWTITIIEP